MGGAKSPLLLYAFLSRTELNLYIFIHLTIQSYILIWQCHLDHYSSIS